MSLKATIVVQLLFQSIVWVSKLSSFGSEGVSKMFDFDTAFLKMIFTDFEAINGTFAKLK